MKILGISAFYHDSAATIVVDGVVIAAAQEERFTRKKHDEAFPANAVQYCLEESGFALTELDAVVFYDKPFLKFERLLETYYGFAPWGIRSFWKAIPVWIREKLFLKKLLRDELKKIGPWDGKKTKLLFPTIICRMPRVHFLSRLMRKRPFSRSTASVNGPRPPSVTARERHRDFEELRFPHSLGLLYSAFTYFLGFRVNSGEYKLMGLAPYGNAASPKIAEYKATILRELIDLKEDGSLWLNQKYFGYATGLRMVDDAKWAALFGFERRAMEAELEQKHCDLASRSKK